MPRVSESVRHLIEPGEPEFQTTKPLEKLEIVLALNWYANNQEKEHSHKYLKQYCKQHNIPATSAQIENQVATLGFVARLIMRGAILDARSLGWFDLRLSQMLKYVPPIVVKKPVVPKPKPDKDAPKPPKETDPKKLLQKALSRKPESQIRSLKYLPEEKTLNVKSINPLKLVGASELWAYHVPSRTLTRYISSNDAGFAVKGCAILNYSEKDSRAKKLRKPETVIPAVVSAGKVVLRSLLDDLSTKDKKATGRVNSKTILLRVSI